MNNAWYIIMGSLIISGSNPSNAEENVAAGQRPIDVLSTLTADNHLERLTAALQSRDIVLVRDLLRASNFTYGEPQLDVLLLYLQNDDARSLWPVILETLPSFPQLGERKEVWGILDQLLEKSEQIPYLRPPVLKCIARSGTDEGFQVLRSLYLSSPSEREKILILRLLDHYQQESFDKVFQGLDETSSAELEEHRLDISAQAKAAKKRPPLSSADTALALADLDSSDEMTRFRSIHRLKNAVPNPGVLTRLKRAFDTEESVKNRGELLVAIAMLETEEGSANYLKYLLAGTLDEALRPLVQHLLAFPPTRSEVFAPEKGVGDKADQDTRLDIK